jgi:hypothetical protein
MARATSSLPQPDSPVMRTVRSPSAASRISSKAARMASLRPMMLSKLYRSLTTARSLRISLKWS